MNNDQETTTSETSNTESYAALGKKLGLTTEEMARDVKTLLSVGTLLGWNLGRQLLAFTVASEYLELEGKKLMGMTDEQRKNAN